MSLSIIIPVFNEIGLLPKILKKIIKATGSIDKEIIIVDDCSNDGTEQWLKEIQKKKYNCITLKKNKILQKITKIKESLKNKYW